MNISAHAQPLVLGLRLAFTVLMPFTLAAATKQEMNSPRLQKQLDKIAAGIPSTKEGSFEHTKVTVGVHALILKLRPTPGIEPSKALKDATDSNWDVALCKSGDTLKFMYQNNVRFIIEFETKVGVTNVIREVTVDSCAKAASAGHSISRIIGGVTFFPKPSSKESIQLVNAYLKKTLLDPASAKLECTDVSEAAWIRPVMLGPKQYGYFMECDINAKNAYGGYAGFRSMIFQFNGGIVNTYEPPVFKSGLMEHSGATP